MNEGNLDDSFAQQQENAHADPKMATKTKPEKESTPFFEMLKPKMLAIPKYDNMTIKEIRSWIGVLDEMIKKNEITADWITQNILSLVDGEVLNFCLATTLYTKTYEEIKTTLCTVYGPSREQMIEEFNALRLSVGGNLIEFFKRKYELGNALKYNEQQIIEHLNLASPQNLRCALIFQEIKDPFQWLEKAKRIYQVTEVPLAEGTLKFIQPRMPVVRPVSENFEGRRQPSGGFSESIQHPSWSQRRGDERYQQWDQHKNFGYYREQYERGRGHNEGNYRGNYEDGRSIRQRNEGQQNQGHYNRDNAENSWTGRRERFQNFSNQQQDS